MTTEPASDPHKWPVWSIRDIHVRDVAIAEWELAQAQARLATFDLNAAK